MPRFLVTHLATGRSMVGTPDELLDRLGSWWAHTESTESVDSHITQLVFEWERGVFDGWRNAHLGVTAVPTP